MTHPLYEALRTVNIITDKNKQNPKNQRLFDKYPDIYSQLLEHTSFLPDDYENRARVHCVMHNITTLPVCKTCNKKVTFNNTKKQFNEYCCHECAWADPDNVAKAKQTKKQRYGDENFNDREKAKITNLERYGATTPAGNESIVKKMRDAWTDEKTQQAAAKRMQTNLEKYGAATFASASLADQVNTLLRDSTFMYEQHHTHRKSVTQMSNELGVSITTVSRWLKSHNIEIRFDNSYISTHELELLQFISTIVNPEQIVTNTRSVIPPHELDIFIPHLRVAIEYNGVFWHSELNGKDRSYHINKHKQCKDNNIDLIQVWSNEWMLKTELVKSRLRAKLVGSNNKAFARKCSIIEMTTVQQRDFFEQNHIQGHVNSSVCYGLVQDDQIQCAMSFIKTRYDNSEGYELLRFANKIDTNVVGGASKLFKHFIKNHNPQRVVSYSMNRWNTGNLYQKLGFEFSHTSSPNYFYFERTDTHVLFSRVNFQKHKLKDKLTNFDPHISEWENMVNNGYDRIWDCGNDVWQWQPKGIDQ